MKLCLDAGHGRNQNRSPAVPEYYEGNRMFVLQEYLKAALEHYGAEVVCTRETMEDDPSLYTRGTMAKGCDLFLSLHSNAVGGSGCNDNVDYVRVFHPVSGQGKALAELLAEVITAVIGTKQQPKIGVRWNSTNNADYYGVLRYSAGVNTTGLLLEHSFHTNPATARWLMEDENLRRLADAEAACIAEYYGWEAPEMRYELLKDVKNPFYRPTLDKLTEKGILNGRSGTGEETVIDLGEDAIRVLVLLDRAGLFGE